MDYLKGLETQANIPVLWTVTRWLAQAGESTYEELVAALRPNAIVKGSDNAFRASLSVARHIGVLAASADSGPWTLGPEVGCGDVTDHHSFSRVVRCAVMKRAVDDVATGNQPADVALGLTWLCSLDPERAGCVGLGSRRGGGGSRGGTRQSHRQQHPVGPVQTLGHRSRSRNSE